MITLEEMETLLLEIELVEKLKKRLENRIEFEIRTGTKPTHFKIVEGKLGNRKFTSTKEAEKLLKQFKLKNSQIYDRKLKGIPAIMDSDILGPRQRLKMECLVERPKGKEKLVKMTSKGKALEFEDFQNLEGN